MAARRRRPHLSRALLRSSSSPTARRRRRSHRGRADRCLLCIRRRLPRAAMAGPTAWQMVPQAPLGAADHPAAVPASAAPAEPRRRGQDARAGHRPHDPRSGHPLHHLWCGRDRLCGVAGGPRGRTRPARVRDQFVRRRIVVGDGHRDDRRVRRSENRHRRGRVGRGGADDRRHHVVGFVTATLASWIVQRVSEEDDAERGGHRRRRSRNCAKRFGDLDGIREAAIEEHDGSRVEGSG